MDSTEDLEFIIDDSLNGDGEALLPRINNDYISSILVLRWIEFMLERVSRDKVSCLLNYYREIGWLSDQAKSQVMAFARGEIQDVNNYNPEEADKEIFTVEGTHLEIGTVYQSASDWRLTAEEHLKSLLFILKIKGTKIDKDRLNALEIDIKDFKSKLDKHLGV